MINCKKIKTYLHDKREEQGIQLCCSPLHEGLDARLAGVYFDGLRSAAVGLLGLALLLKEHLQRAPLLMQPLTAIMWNSAPQASAEEYCILLGAASICADDWNSCSCTMPFASKYR